MNRRGFLGSILALGAAPAIVRADSLMRIVPMDLGIVVVPELATRPVLDLVETQAAIQEVIRTLTGLGLWNQDIERFHA